MKKSPAAEEPRPRIVLFSEEQIEHVVTQAMEVLETVGVCVENLEARALLDGAGQRVDGRRVRIGPDLVRRALGTVPACVTLWDRPGRHAIELGGDRVHFDPGSAALFILDPSTNRRRPPTRRDCVHLAWVTQACRSIEAQSTALVPRDVPEQVADRYRLYLALRHGVKPVVTGTFRKDSFAPMREMLVAVRGSDAALRERPLAIVDCCPTPPLTWSDLTGQALVDAARAGVPAELISMPMGGATAPVTLREVVLQHCAESLSGVVIHQLACPGAPLLWGGSPSAFDMRHGTAPMGAIETMMVDVANGQVGKHLGLPTHAYMALGDGKVVDHQAGAETAAGAVLAALAGINMVSGPGMLDYENCQSLEKLLLDDEVCGMALRLTRGIGPGSPEQAVALLQSLAETGQILGHPHTRARWRSEIRLPGPLVERRSYGDWEAAGAPSSWDASKAEVARILARGATTPLPPEVEAELHRVMRNEAVRIGWDAWSPADAEA